MIDSLFQIEDRVCIITGGGGLLGRIHAEAALKGGGIPVLLGRTLGRLEKVKYNLSEKYIEGRCIEIFDADITDRKSLENVRDALLDKYGRIDVLINNAANNPKVEEASSNMSATGFTDFPMDIWNKDLEVGLTGAVNCCQIFGREMEKAKRGVILNISSDYGIIAPDQRIYDGVVKPVSYSVVKHGIIGLTKYLAAYWGSIGIRTNVLCPSGIYNGQDDGFVEKFVNNVPMGRMSKPEEYVGTVLYMISDASSFMNGATVVIDGGKTIW